MVSHEVVVNLIASTKTKGGLSISCVMDTNKYATGKKIGDNDMNALNIEFDDSLPSWNYCIKPSESCSI